MEKKREYRLEEVFNPETGKTEYVLSVVKKEKPLPAGNRRKKSVGRFLNGTPDFGRQREQEDKNPAVSGMQETGQTAVQAGKSAIGAYPSQRFRLQGRAGRRQEKIGKLEKKQFKLESQAAYLQFLEENPVRQGASFQERVQKQAQKRAVKKHIQKKYAKALRAKQEAKGMEETVLATFRLSGETGRKLREAAGKRVPFLAVTGAGALLVLVLMAALSSCGAMFSEGMSLTVTGSYLSVPAELDASDLILSKLEAELQKEISAIEEEYPGYDEYHYNLAPIGHDPYTLVSYLSAVHTEFTVSDVQGEIEGLFGEMYELILTPTEEVRVREVQVKDAEGNPLYDEGGESVTEEEAYTVTILEVTLSATALEEIAGSRMDTETRGIYDLYGTTHGLIQQFYSPLALYWYPYMGSYYGYRINPVTGEEQFHRGVDIAVPAGTTVYASMDGMVVTAAYDDGYGNYVVIEDENGYCTKYAHMDSLGVSAGQGVKHGEAIGKTGSTGSSTGSHLHIECLYNGEYYNPLFYFLAGEGTLYGEEAGSGSSTGNVIPPDSYDDAAVQALMAEAAKYLGYDYVWGGSSPSTGFDCSGFVSYVFQNSGVYNLQRTNAQGIYNQCVPIPALEAKAGDIIFFTGTYSSGNPVSHVGIYCGNGIMIHAGDPIKYSNINTSYWQSHFYSFGRLG